MKKTISILAFLAMLRLSPEAQPVTEYSYKLDNGIIVKSERCWNQVWVQQLYAPITANDKMPLSVNIRTLGDLISGSSFKLLSAGKEVKMQGAAPGTYNLKLTFKLSGNPGTLGFIVNNIIIKAKTKTSVTITLYDYQLKIAESPASLKGLSFYETQIDKCKTHTTQDLYLGIPTFYAKGKHDKPIPADELITKTSGRIKAGTYDLLISIGISGQTHKVWLENFLMKPDINYKITTNLNAGGIAYAGGNKDVETMLLYPAGTAAKQTGTPAPNKSLEIISYNNMKLANCCSPGTYDVLLSLKNSSKYEWRKNIVIMTGTQTDVK
jgi:hypothetical protein